MLKTAGFGGRFASDLVAGLHRIQWPVCIGIGGRFPLDYAPKKKPDRPRMDEREKRVIPGYRARRWVVERTHSWLNRFRRLLIRWEKKVDNYLAMLHFACTWITFRAAGLFG